MQISCAVTAQLISAFVFAIQIVQFLFFQNPKFQAFNLFLGLYRLVCVGPGRKHQRPVFLRRGSIKPRIKPTTSGLQGEWLNHYKQLLVHCFMTGLKKIRKTSRNLCLKLLICISFNPFAMTSRRCNTTKDVL